MRGPVKESYRDHLELTDHPVLTSVIHAGDFQLRPPRVLDCEFRGSGIEDDLGGFRLEAINPYASLVLQFPCTLGIHPRGHQLGGVIESATC